MKRKMKAILIIAALLLVFAEVVYAEMWRSQSKITKTPHNLMSCALIWGSWHSEQGPIGSYCGFTTKDSGKSCTLSSQCQLGCIYTYQDLGDPSGSDSDTDHTQAESRLTHGRCDTGSSTLGCVGFFEGKASGISCP